METIKQQNIENQTYNESIYFDRCNITNCTFNESCTFERCNLLDCEILAECEFIKSNVNTSNDEEEEYDEEELE